MSVNEMTSQEAERAFAALFDLVPKAQWTTRANQLASLWPSLRAREPIYQRHRTELGIAEAIARYDENGTYLPAELRVIDYEAATFAHLVLHMAKC